MINDRTKAYYDLKNEMMCEKVQRGCAGSSSGIRMQKSFIVLRTRSCWNSLVKQELYIEWMEPF